MQTGRILPWVAETAVTRARLVIAGSVAKQVIPAVDGTEQYLGVAKYAASAGDAAQIECDGVVLIESGAAVAVGVQVMADSVGRGITATGTGAYSVGISLQAAGGAGEFIEVQVVSGGPLA